MARIERGGGPAGLRLEIRADQIKHIPANVGAQIRASTAFGAKFVDLTFPQDPNLKRLAANAVLVSSNVTTEVNTVFQNLVNVLDQIDPAKLNAVLTALSQGFRGQGHRIGETISDANQILLELNPRSDAIRQDWRSLKDFSDTYAASAADILAILDAASTAVPPFRTMPQILTLYCSVRSDSRNQEPDCWLRTRVISSRASISWSRPLRCSSSTIPSTPAR